LLVEFPEASRFFTIKGNYDVWSTDYETYALVYSCKSALGLFKFESAWILARQKSLDAATVNKLKVMLQSRGVNANKFAKTKQICDN
jgi:lipocalin